MVTCFSDSKVLVFSNMMYFGVLSEKIELIYLGILSHLMYAVCCVCRIVYVAFKLSKSHGVHDENNSFGTLCTHMLGLNAPYIFWYLANLGAACFLKKLKGWVGIFQISFKRQSDSATVPIFHKKHVFIYIFITALNRKFL